MAIAKDSRSLKEKRRSTGGNNIRTHPGFDSAKRCIDPEQTDSSPEKLAASLNDITRRLDVVVAVAMTIDQALRHQNSGLDKEFAQCLRWAVTDRLSGISRDLEALAVAGTHQGRATP